MTTETPQPSAPRDGTRRGGLAAWSIRHPVGVVMLTLAVGVVGAFAFTRLPVDLLPHIIYPEVRVRVLNPGVPAKIMEDQITRQLEEQLAITEDAINVQSTTTEGRSAVDLAFRYGTDIDRALRDASTRLDRAKRFLPDTIDPPIIFKRDPSQRPVAEFVVSSRAHDGVTLRTWTDDVFAKWFLNLPGVAAVEIGGGLRREIQVLPDQQRLAGLGLGTADLIAAIQRGNIEEPAGRVRIATRELSSRTAARFDRVQDIERLPLPLANGTFVRLREVADVADTHEQERLRVRLNGTPGIKVSIQKQPTANTVAAVDAVRQRLADLQRQGIIPAAVHVAKVADQATYVRSALRNAASAALSGALLAMAVVYLFLGNLRRTLIIGSVIPIAVLVTFLLMDLGGLTLNIMTLGGLAVGIGMLVDNTIVMLENIHRHQQTGESDYDAGTRAAAEVNSAIVASTTTNLAAIVPFLFISGLIGLLFRELIFTITAAIVASMVVALTVTPALGARVHSPDASRARAVIDRLMTGMQGGFAFLIMKLLARPLLKIALASTLIAGLALSVPWFLSARQDFLPKLDDGRITIRITADPGVNLEETDRSVRTIEALIRAQHAVQTVFTTTGGFIFGRSEYEARNKATIDVQLLPLPRRSVSSEQWVKGLQRAIDAAALAGVRARISTGGLRGIPLSRGSDDISLRVQGPDLDTLNAIGRAVTRRLSGIAGIRNVALSSEETSQELAVKVDRDRATALGLTAEAIGDAVRTAIDGKVISDYIDGDRSFDIRLRLPGVDVDNLQSLESLFLGRSTDGRTPVYLGDVARVHLIQSAAEILRDNQQRIVEVTASMSGDVAQGIVTQAIKNNLAGLDLPKGYTIYDAGISRTLQQGTHTAEILLGLALFLVFVVMAVHYESLRNPLVILLSAPFCIIGVALGLVATHMHLSMPVWLGLIMLAGIVVNNAIVLVEYIEICRESAMSVDQAIVSAAGQRLRPILMTTLTTVVGLLPLALAWGEGAEMLQPLAVTIVSGLSFSLLVSLFLVPVIYQAVHRRTPRRLQPS
ncbi:MAG: efflux RND transporter permease subunit [Gammaproteobacteria bacterium]